MSLMSPALAAGFFTSGATWETLPGSHGNSIFSFLRKLRLLSIVAAPIYVPSNSEGGFPFWKLFCLFVLKTLWMWRDGAE